MRVGSFHIMRRVNIGSFMYRVNESILEREELKKTDFQKAIEGDSIDELKNYTETEIVEDFDFETQVKLEQRKEELEELEIEKEMDQIIEIDELEQRNNSFKKWLFSNKLNSEHKATQELKPILDTEYFRFVKKDGLSIEDLMTRVVASGWLYTDPSDIGLNELIELIETNPINEDII